MDETHEGEDGSPTRSPFGTLPPDAVLLASSGSTLPAPTSPGISTRLPPGAKRRRNGSYSVTIGVIDVTILRDTKTRRSRLRNRAKTSLRMSWTTPGYQHSGGKIVKHEAPTVSARIQTTYGPGAKGSDRSGYGKGTTLRDHEGHHGADFLAYMTANQPAFTGRIGMSITEFRKAVTDFETYMSTYDRNAAEKSEKETDCTGVKASFCE